MGLRWLGSRALVAPPRAAEEAAEGSLRVQGHPRVLLHERALADGVLVRVAASDPQCCLPDLLHEALAVVVDTVVPCRLL